MRIRLVVVKYLIGQSLEFCSASSIQGRGEEGKKEVKSSSLPNTFEDDCSTSH